MNFSSPQYPLFLAAVFFLYGLARTGRWPGSIARVALMVILGDLVYVLLTHRVDALWDPIGGLTLAALIDAPAPAWWHYPLGLIVLGGSFRLGLDLAGRHLPATVAEVAARHRGGPVAARVVRRGKKGKRGRGGKRPPARAAAVAPDPGDPIAAEQVSSWTAHILSGALVALGLGVVIAWQTDTLDALSATASSVGHLVYLVGLGFAIGAAQSERGRHLGRVLILGLVSAVFYHAWAAGQTGAYQYLLALIAATIVLDFYLARWIEASDHAGVRLALLIASLVSNLGILAAFKYADFFRLEVLGLDGEPWGLLLPAGISFHTFQSLSYTVDVYRREIRATRSVIELATFVLFFPQLVAGPIVRARELLPQLRDLPLFERTRAADGLFRILVGLSKKLVLADFLGGALADRVFHDPSLYSSVEVAAGVMAYAFQIYLDFSAYSDIAIGSAQVLGFSLPENFETPYRSASLQEFWRRWHISLSSWLRDYLYIPLGGNRGTELTTYRNLILTMLLGGLWHGANWTFIAWGLLHGGGLAVTRVFQRAARPWLLVLIAAALFAVGLTLDLFDVEPGRPWAHLAFAWAYTVPLWAAVTALLGGLPEPRVAGAPRPTAALVLRLLAGAQFAVALTLLHVGPVAAVTPFVILGAALALAADVAERGPTLDEAVAWVGWAAARAVAVALVFAYVCLAWIFFRAPDFDRALAVLRRLGAGEYDAPNLIPVVKLALIAALVAHWFAPRTFAAARTAFVRAPWWAQGLLLALAARVLAEFSHPTIVPFIYFQF